MAKLETLLHDLRVSVVGTDDDPRVGALSRPARLIGRPLVKLFYRAEIRGLHHVPLIGPAIMSPNHLSFFDTPLVMTTSPRPVIFLGKAEYMNSKATKFLFPAIGMVPIKRDVAKASMAALITAGELLEAGQIVGIYPEGTRTRDGYLHRGHSGVAQLALMTGAPIVPVGIVGTERVQPIGQSFPKPFQGRVRISFGEPIYPQRYQYGGSRKRRQQITDDVMASIASMTSQQRSSDFSSDRPPLIRGGSESVYLITSHKADGLSWRHAAERAVDDGRRTYDDARVGEVRALTCRIGTNGELEFQAELALSTRLSGPQQPKPPTIRVAAATRSRSIATRLIATKKGTPE
ncbi:MAG TPA: lysophospholipid acyltransferase family protein [Ilumatobacter sp.]|nr:lysophospholipid acyltransferase family protein [Ilumatobacter sp.]